MGDLVSRALRVAMIGTGRWAERLVFDIAGAPEVELVACYDRDAAARDRFAAELGVAALPSVDALVKNDIVEAALLCVPNASHKDLALELAVGGKHVFVPSPVAESVRSAREMAEAAEKTGVVLFVDHSASLHPVIETIRREAEAGRVGKLIGAHVFRSEKREEEAGKADWRLSPRHCPGGPASTVGVEAAANLVRLMGRPNAVRASLASGLSESRVPDLVTLLVEHESGAHSTLVTTATSAVASEHMHFYGTGGVISCSPSSDPTQTRAQVAEETTGSVYELMPSGEHLNGIQMFAARVIGGIDPPATLDLAMTALATVEAGLMSVAEDRRVFVSELLPE
jgi:predicted dehydrogenase